MAPRCLARQACLALCAGVAAFALIGCGGDGPTSKAEKTCARLFDKAVGALKERYNSTNIEKCQSLRGRNEDKFDTDELGTDFEEQCVTKANVDAAQYMKAHEANYTATCIAEMSNISNATESDEADLELTLGDSADLIVDPQMEGTYDKLVDGISGGGSEGGSSGTGSEGGSSGSDIVVTEAEDEKGEDENGEDEKGEAEDEKGEDENGEDENGEDENGEASSSSSSRSAIDNETARLFEDPKGGILLSSGGSLRPAAVSVASLAALLLVVSWATAKAVRHSQRRTTYENLGCEVTLE